MVIEPVLTSTPALAVPLGEMKAHLDVDLSDDDETIGGLIRAATDYMERATGRRIPLATWRLELPCFLPWIDLDSPLQSVTSVDYLNAAGQRTTLGALDYSVWTTQSPGKVRIVNQPSYTADRPDSVRVTYVAGYDALAVPPLIKAGLKLIVGHWYANRESVVIGTIAAEVPFAAQSIIDTVRSWRC